MDGDIPDLPRFIEIARRHGAWLMVDKAHAVGVVGARGHGVHEHFGIDPNEVDIWMDTPSKTLSGCGGYILGNASLNEWLCHSVPGLVYSVWLAPALAQPQGTASRFCMRNRKVLRGFRPMRRCSCN